MIEKAPLGYLDQGTIFSCAYAERYQDFDVWGVIITARCDIAHAKMPVYSYLPIVRLDSWFLHDGKDIFLSRIINEITGSIKSKLKSLGLSDSLVKSKSPRTIYEKSILPLDIPGDRNNKKKNDFLEVVEKHEKLVSILATTPTLNQMKELGATYFKQLEGVIKELTSNRLAGYYFIARLEPEREIAHVVLLREVHHMPSINASLISNGIDQDTYHIHKDSNDQYTCPRFVSQDDFSMPISRISSPWIEHLMQSFANLFIRIGLPDIDDEVTGKIIQNLSSKGE